MSWARSFICAIVLFLGWQGAAWAQTGCVPNPNLAGAPHFVDGCPLPASALNASFSRLSMGCANILNFGGAGDNVTDNVAAWNLAKAASPSCIDFPAGSFYFASPVSVTVPANSGTTIRGVAGATKLRFASGADGILVTTTGFACSIHVRDLVVMASGLPSLPTHGLTITQSQPNTVPQHFPPTSDVTNVTFMGDDGNQGLHAWQTAIFIDKQPNINFVGDTFLGTSNYGADTTAGIYFHGGPDLNTNLAFQYNIIGSGFTALHIGLTISTNVQGVIVQNSTFVSDSVGFYIPAGAIFPAQITFMGNNCNCSEWCVQDATGFPESQYIGNTVYLPGNTSGGFQVKAFDPVFQGNTFFAQGNANVAIDIFDAYGQGIGVISGNTFNTLTSSPSAIHLGANTSKIRVAGNNMFSANITNPIVNDSSNFGNIINYSQNFSAATLVTGAVSNGGSPALVRLTVNDTTSFRTGQVVSVNGIVGVPANFIVPIHVIDGTHMDLLGVVFTGAYSSGGSVAALP